MDTSLFKAETIVVDGCEWDYYKVEPALALSYHVELTDDIYAYDAHIHGTTNHFMRTCDLIAFRITSKDTASLYVGELVQKAWIIEKAFGDFMKETNNTIHHIRYSSYGASMKFIHDIMDDMGFICDPFDLNVIRSTEQLSLHLDV